MGLAGLFGISGASATIPAIKTSPDAELIGLGAQFDDIAARIDFAVEHSGPGQSYYTRMLTDAIEAYGAVYVKVTVLPATSLEGLRVKARIAKWSSAGKMYPEDTAILIDPMALSLAEDLLNFGTDQA